MYSSVSGTAPWQELQSALQFAFFREEQARLRRVELEREVRLCEAWHSILRERVFEAWKAEQNATTIRKIYQESACYVEEPKQLANEVSKGNGEPQSECEEYYDCKEGQSDGEDYFSQEMDDDEDDDEDRDESYGEKKRARGCSKCKLAGHNARTCPSGKKPQKKKRKQKA